MRNLLLNFSRSLTKKKPQTSQSLLAELPFAFSAGSVIDEPNRQLMVDRLQASCRQQLSILHKSLNLRTAALLWPGPGVSELSLYAAVSDQQLLDGPFPVGVGVTGALKDHRRLIVAPCRPQSPAIPYYHSLDGVGSLFAERLDLVSLTRQRNCGSVILCVDRESSECWNEREQEIFSLAVEQLTQLIEQAREHYLCDRQRHAYVRAFDGLRTLNASLGLQSACVAAVDAVGRIVPADFVAVSLLDGERHSVIHANGDHADRLLNQSFPADQGLVGQVLKYARTLPEHADYGGASPVFSEAHLFVDYKSLMIVPIAQEEMPVIGALIVAARSEGVFSRTCREILEMLASQMAVKIELAQSHEQINRLATIDALTGIANRRAYQKGFEAMLERADRRGSSLYLILSDIDYFKRVNDRYGHPFGDEVLCQVARLFERVVRTVDLAARTGGEEFAILLEDSDESGAMKVAERLRELVSQLDLNSGGEQVPVTISLGIAAYPQDAGSLEKLVSCADQALYQAKNAGRNRTVRWQD